MEIHQNSYAELESHKSSTYTRLTAVLRINTGYDINGLFREALTRWLKPAEVLFILQNHEKYQLTEEPPQQPTSGSLFLFNKRVLRFFRRDGHNWRKKKDGRTVGEAHERLKVGNVEALNCYYAHGEQNPSFQRRSYWMLDPAYEHIVLVHYRETNEGKATSGSVTLLSPGSPSTFSQSPCSYTKNPGSNSIISDFFDPYQSLSSPEVSSEIAIKNNGMDHLDRVDRREQRESSPELEVTQALRRLEEQLSLNEDSVTVVKITINRLGMILPMEVKDLYLGQRCLGHITLHQVLSPRVKTCTYWMEIIDNHLVLPASMSLAEEADRFKFPAYSSEIESHGTNSNYYMTFFDQDQTGIPLEADSSLTVSQKQKFTIREISPEWGYANEATKIIQEGVICCEAPPHLPGKVTLCITSGNRESCSEVREFEYRSKTSACAHCNSPNTEAAKSPEELLLLVRFVQMLLFESLMQKGDTVESEIQLLRRSKADDDSWGHVIEALLVGSGTSSSMIDWILQELLKDKLCQWLSSISQEGPDQTGCSLSKKEQGIIHMVAGLGFEWALNPILNYGVNINFRDINGWTALHWAARFGSEESEKESRNRVNEKEY
ncbi:calmodulin-binding transcription activator 4 [Quercus suber]|uniref:Calmodulin-binding transcription activator 4 n=1 Tax=Quercus suber TaxID=58331 RepID=A0AAW0LJP8_QUESU